MKKFYYQIKGRRPAKNEYGEDEWAWPPVFSGMVEAGDRKSARASLEQEYERKFPMAVMRKDMAKNDYLLHIQEVGEHDTYLLSQFEDKACKECGTVFKLMTSTTTRTSKRRATTTVPRLARRPRSSETFLSSAWLARVVRHQ